MNRLEIKKRLPIQVPLLLFLIELVPTNPSEAVHFDRLGVRSRVLWPALTFHTQY